MSVGVLRPLDTVDPEVVSSTLTLLTNLQFVFMMVYAPLQKDQHIYVFWFQARSKLSKYTCRGGKQYFCWHRRSRDTHQPFCKLCHSGELFMMSSPPFKSVLVWVKCRFFYEVLEFITTGSNCWLLGGSSEKKMLSTIL